MNPNAFIEPTCDLPRLAAVLDELGHRGRVATIRSWHRNEQARLFEAAKGFRPLTLEHLVPDGRAPLTEVIHWGQNTLPAFNRFQKRFCKPSDAEKKGVLYGYNHQANEPFIGPGYFLARPSHDGELIVDYGEIPGEKPESWPKIIANTARLGRFVWHGMVDVLRGLSAHVSIGRAKKGGDYMDAWFALVREDAN